MNFQQQLGRGSHLGWFFRGGWASDDAATLTGVRCGHHGLVLLSPSGEKALPMTATWVSVSSGSRG
ncbi:MAG: hypothetical protein ACLSUW_04020 [Akkermansia sp.]